MRAQYDEDLESNPFFESFKLQHPILFENSIRKNWIVLVPYLGSFTKAKYDDFDFLNHVLVPITGEKLSHNESIYKTLGNQKIQISESSMVIYSKDPEKSKRIQILFEETYYTDDDKAYKVLCISEPLTVESASKIDKKSENGKVFALNSVEDSKSFLWKIMAKINTKKKVDELISNVKSQLHKLNSPTVQECYEIAKNLYVSSFQTITSHKTYMNVVNKNENLKSSMKLALEMYLCNSISNQLFAALTDATAERDEEINKATRAAQNIRASRSGIRFDMCENIPKAKKELSLMRKTTTPLEICECIRKVMSELSRFNKPRFSASPSLNDGSIQSIASTIPIQPASFSASKSNSGLMVNTDDLLSALIFLVIKSEIANWYTYLEYASHFRFAPCSRDDEYQYYLTTLEATLEHIRNMNINPVEEDIVMDVSTTLSLTSVDSSFNNWDDISQAQLSSGRVGAVAYELNQVRQLFRLIESGQTFAVKELIQRSYRSDYSTGVTRRTVGPSSFNGTQQNDHYCHPLCDCKAVIVDRKSCQSLVERSKRLLDIQTLPESKTFDTVESTQKRYSIDNHSPQPLTFSLSSVDDKGWNAFHKAAYCGKLEILNLLMDFQYLIDSTSLEGETPLHLAARRGHQDIIFALLDMGAEINIKNFNGQTALHIAVEHDYSSCVSTLIYYASLQSNLIIDNVNSSGNTPLHIAAMWGYESIVHCLLDHSANAIIKNNRGLRPADMASTRKLARIIKIAAHKQELEAISKETAASISNILQSDSSQSVSGGTLKNGKKKVSTHTLKDSEIIAKEILNKKSSFSSSVTLNQKVEKLLKAVADGDIQMMKFMLEISDDTELEKPINIHQDLCHPLCQCSKCRPLQDLIIKSNNQQLHINSTNKEGFHCLHISAIHDRSTIAKFLLLYGADENVKTHKLELTPLHLAATYGSVKVLNLLLLQKNIFLNAVDKKLNSPLLYACGKTNVDVVEFLLQAGASVNISNHKGNTPLHEAVLQNQADIVHLLIKYGADLNCVNNKGLTPIELSKDLNIYFTLKNLMYSKERKNSKYVEVDATESGMVSLNSSIHTDHNMFNVEADVLSIDSDISLPSSQENDSNSNDQLFPDDIKLDISSQLLLDKSDSSTVDIDIDLLERIDKNSKYNYRLIFKDSPSISSTNSSK